MGLLEFFKVTSLEYFVVRVLGISYPVTLMQSRPAAFSAFYDWRLAIYILFVFHEEMNHDRVQSRVATLPLLQSLLIPSGLA